VRRRGLSRRRSRVRVPSLPSKPVQTGMHIAVASTSERRFPRLVVSAAGRCNRGRDSHTAERVAPPPLRTRAVWVARPYDEHQPEGMFPQTSEWLYELAFRESDGIDVTLLWDGVETACFSTSATVGRASGSCALSTAPMRSMPTGTRSRTRRDDAVTRAQCRKLRSRGKEPTMHRRLHARKARWCSGHRRKTGHSAACCLGQ
jgi:hypothetical protein